MASFLRWCHSSGDGGIVMVYWDQLTSVVLFLFKNTVNHVIVNISPLLHHLQPFCPYVPKGWFHSSFFLFLHTIYLISFAEILNLNSSPHRLQSHLCLEVPLVMIPYIYFPMHFYVPYCVHYLSTILTFTFLLNLYKLI